MTLQLADEMSIIHYKRWAAAFALTPFKELVKLSFSSVLLVSIFKEIALKFCGSERWLSTLRSLCTVLSWIASSLQTLWGLVDYVGLYFLVKEDWLHRVFVTQGSNFTPKDITLQRYSGLKWLHVLLAWWYIPGFPSALCLHRCTSHHFPIHCQPLTTR